MEKYYRVIEGTSDWMKKNNLYNNIPIDNIDGKIGKLVSTYTDMYKPIYNYYGLDFNEKDLTTICINPIQLIEYISLNKYRHFFLYAKGYYKQDNLINDLRILVSDFYNNNSMDYEFVDIGDIYKILSKCIKNYVNSSDKFLTFTEYLFSVGNLGMPNDSSDSLNLSFINTCLSIMRDASIKEDNFSEGTLIIDGELGLPDSSILPLSEE
jgi:hypothetical protein